MAHLCVFTRPNLEVTWIGASDDPGKCRWALAAEEERSEAHVPWAFFFRQGHLLQEVLNAFESWPNEKGWYAIHPEEAIHTITALCRDSFAGYRAWQYQLLRANPEG